MIRILLPLVCLVAAALPYTLDEASEEVEASPLEIDSLSFLAGAWSGKAWGGTFHARYSTADNGIVLSHSRLVKDGTEKFYEFELFEPHGDGVRLRPYPGGRAAMHLDLVSVDAKAKKAVFENTEKDYPTRITYERPTRDRLIITLTDPHGGSKKTETFDLKRLDHGEKKEEQAR